MDLKKFLSDFYSYTLAYGNPRQDDTYVHNLIEVSKEFVKQIR